MTNAVQGIHAKKGRRAAYWRCLWIALGVFFACDAISLMAWREIFGRENIAPVASALATENSYFAFHSEELDTPILYYGLDHESLSNLMQADVLFLGNSRLQFACKRRVLQPFFERHSLKYFVLGFGNNEPVTLPLDIIRHFNLHPKLIVINADSFFTTGLSKWGERIVREGEWPGIKRVIEGQCSFWSQRYVHSCIPKWSAWEDVRKSKQPLVVFRSRDNGEWLLQWSHSAAPAGRPFDCSLNDNTSLDLDSMSAVDTYKEEIRSRGAKTVLTLIPSPRMGAINAAATAARLAAPLLLPQADGLQSVDSSHLDEASAERVINQILEDLARTAEFHAIAR